MRKTIVFFISVFFLTAALIAQPPIPDPAKRWVIDDANILDEGTEHTISSLVQEHFDSTSNQVVVYTFNSLEGSTIEDYANAIYNKWHLGTKENNNGVLLIIAVEDHKMRIEVGYGLEKDLTDLETQDIIQNDIRPKFKEGNYNEGVLNGVQAILTAIKGTYKSEAGSNDFKMSNRTLFIILLVFTEIGRASCRERV